MSLRQDQRPVSSAFLEAVTSDGVATTTSNMALDSNHQSSNAFSSGDDFDKMSVTDLHTSTSNSILASAPKNEEESSGGASWYSNLMAPKEIDTVKEQEYHFDTDDDDDDDDVSIMSNNSGLGEEVAEIARLREQLEAHVGLIQEKDQDLRLWALKTAETQRGKVAAIEFGELQKAKLADMKELRRFQNQQSFERAADLNKLNTSLHVQFEEAQKRVQYFQDELLREKEQSQSEYNATKAERQSTIDKLLKDRDFMQAKAQRLEGLLIEQRKNALKQTCVSQERLATAQSLSRDYAAENTQLKTKLEEDREKVLEALDIIERMRINSTAFAQERERTKAIFSRMKEAIQSRDSEIAALQEVSKRHTRDLFISEEQNRSWLRYKQSFQKGAQQSQRLSTEQSQTFDMSKFKESIREKLNGAAKTSTEGVHVPGDQEKKNAEKTVQDIYNHKHQVFCSTKDLLARFQELQISFQNASIQLDLARESERRALVMNEHRGQRCITMRLEVTRAQQELRQSQNRVQELEMKLASVEKVGETVPAPFSMRQASGAGVQEKTTPEERSSVEKGKMVNHEPHTPELDSVKGQPSQEASGPSEMNSVGGTRPVGGINGSRLNDKPGTHGSPLFTHFYLPYGSKLGASSMNLPFKTSEAKSTFHPFDERPTMTCFPQKICDKIRHFPEVWHESPSAHAYGSMQTNPSTYPTNRCQTSLQENVAGEVAFNEQGGAKVLNPLQASYQPMTMSRGPPNKPIDTTPCQDKPKEQYTNRFLRNPYQEAPERMSDQEKTTTTPSLTKIVWYPNVKTDETQSSESRTPSSPSGASISSEE